MSAKSKENSPGDSKTPIDSATVVLLREGGKDPFEVFLMRRHKAQSFMGGAYVFPGGRLDQEDCDPKLVDLGRGLGPGEASRRLQEPDLPERVALGLHFCAMREMFEEAGAILAMQDGGGMVEGDRAEAICEHRGRVHDGSLTLLGLAANENLSFPLDLLVPYSHWITPEIEKKRFNTRFFLARLPRGQSCRHDEVELVTSIWLTPKEALDKNRNGEILLMPPTLKTLEEIGEFKSLDELFASASSRSIHPILPQTFKTEDGFGVKLPTDPEYTIADYKQPTPPGETTRLVMKNRRWSAHRCDGQVKDGQSE